MIEERGEYHREDAQLVARTRAGEQEAFRQLFEAYHPLVYRLAYRMLGDAESATDLTQEVFVRAYERLHSLRDGQAFHAWLTRLAANMAHDALRRRKPPAFSLDAPPPGMEEGSEWALAHAGPGAEERLLSHEMSQRLQQALLTLSTEHRAVVILHHLEGMPVEEIGTTLEIPTGTVKSRLARARAELRRKLEGYLEE